MASFLFIFLSILAVMTPNEASRPFRRREGRPIVPGGSWPIDNTRDPMVVEIARFAVAEHNKVSNTSLSLVTVVKGEQAVVAGMRYWLDISAKDGGGSAAPKTYRATVVSLPRQPWKKFLELQSFEEIEDQDYKTYAPTYSP